MITRLFLLIVSLTAFISLSADSTDMAYAAKPSCSNTNSTLEACDSQSDRYSIATFERQIARSSSQELAAESESDSDVQAKELEWSEDMDNNNENIESEIPSLVSAIPFP
jgi:curli biogenesis system outer membrane secretion channel CsgG